MGYVPSLREFTGHKTTGLEQSAHATIQIKVMLSQKFRDFHTFLL
jgi:hypothetical protein